MKNSVAGFVCCFVLLLLACAPAPEPEPEAAPEPAFDRASEEAAIRELVEQWYATANNHDIDAGMALTDDNFKYWATDRAEMEQLMAEAFEGRFRNVEYKPQGETNIRFITPGVAIYDDRYDFSGALDADGNTLPPSKWMNAYVLVKKNGKWLFASFYQQQIED